MISCIRVSVLSLQISKNYCFVIRTHYSYLKSRPHPGNVAGATPSISTPGPSRARRKIVRKQIIATTVRSRSSFNTLPAPLQLQCPSCLVTSTRNQSRSVLSLYPSSIIYIGEYLLLLLAEWREQVRVDISSSHLSLAGTRVY